MLVLTRKSQDSIRIGDNITVTVLRIKGNMVRIGVEAPESVRIVRGELPNFTSLETTSTTTESLQGPLGEPVPNDPQRKDGEQPSVPTASRLKPYLPAMPKTSQDADPSARGLPPVEDLSARNPTLPLPPR